MGTILANFQATGNLPVVRDKLKIFVTLGTTEGAVTFSILADTASALVPFFDIERRKISWCERIVGELVIKNVG